MSVATLLERLVAAPPMRKTADVLLGQYARRRVSILDSRPPAQVQREALRRLVRRARFTRFGRDHNFAKIRDVADYQRRVPLRGYEDFWNDYWQPSFPDLTDATWPDPVPYLALSSGTTSGATKYIPVSPQMLKSNRRAAFTTLALFLKAYPRTPLFTGRLFFLGGSTDLRQVASREGDPLARSASEGIRHSPLAGDLSGIAARELHSFFRPYTFPPLDLALLHDWEKKMQLLAERSAALPVTLVSGVPSWLLVLFERLRQVTGKECIADIWPALRVVVHGGTKFDPYRAQFSQLIGNDAVRFLEVYPASEGFIATEDPRYGLLRLVPDLGIFFEFVPLEDLGKDRPARHTIAEIEPGVQYAVVVTTCSGLWSYVIGDTVCFEKRDPPLLRFTGRTRYFLSAFGEHVISEEVERAVAQAAEATGAAVVEFHVGPVFPERPNMAGRHRYLIEFAQAPADTGRFASQLDAALGRLNEDYQAHRQGDLAMLAPEVVAVRRGGFADWLRSRGQLGGQHKVPRMDNTGRLTTELSHWLADTAR